MPVQVYIDGQEGTTGLKILERFEGRSDIALLKIDPEKRKDNAERKRLIHQSDITFLCLPDAAAVEAVALAEGSNTRIIDASTAHRTNPDWAYGFPELSAAHREKIKNSKRIAVPGCHASGFISLVYPLIEAGAISPDTLLTCHSLTGYSGGGKKMIAEYEDAEPDVALESPRQYGLNQNHKHLKEMKAITGINAFPAFCPIVADYYSGMLVTVPLFREQLNDVTIEDIKKIYANKYHSDIVKYKDEIGENGFICSNKLSFDDSMEIFVEGNEDRILLMSRYDNLGKGASGAAIQNMNILLGTDEKTGLEV